MSLLEKVQRALCEAAVVSGGGQATCPFCKREPGHEPICEMWPTFEPEARAAVAAVRKSDRGK